MRFIAVPFRFCVAVPLWLGSLAAGGVAVSAADQTPSLPVPVFSTPPSLAGTIDTTWSTGARADLTHDFVNHRAADEPTSVEIGQDATSFYLAFDVTQREPFVESSETNGSSVTSDDYVGVYFFPEGTTGFQYAFFANPRGTRYQTSSENSAYTPQWTAVTKRTTAGYTVTMQIPLNIIRSNGRTSWRAQFVRATVHTNASDVWAYDAAASNLADPNYCGHLDNIAAPAAAARPRPRAQIYGLAEGTNNANGGDTSRIGADLALPVTPTASLLASLHPDYSNVDVDQQTIAPTAFARQYSEVRPFFTQAASAFNYATISFNSPELLYTPAIPTLRDGYALEGTQGHVTFGAFDAVGIGRTDLASAIDYNNSNTWRDFGLDLQNVQVNGTGGLHDTVSSANVGYINAHSHEFAFYNFADESGASITNANMAKSFEGGVGYASATTTIGLFYQGIGSQFAPADAYVSQNDVNGLNFLVSDTQPFKAGKLLHDISGGVFAAQLNDHEGQPSQNDVSAQVAFDFSDLLTVRPTFSESGIRTYTDQFLPFDGSGLLVGYNVATSTPTTIQYQGGPYYHGNLDAWTYSTTLKVAPRVHLALEADEDQYLSTYPGEMRTNQWLERASLDFQFSREAQFDLGARRLIGSFLPQSQFPPDFTAFSGGNVSAAFHFLAKNGKSEFYAVYGDPNSLSTTPALFLKYIRYVGAPKGT